MVANKIADILNDGCDWFEKNEIAMLLTRNYSNSNQEGQVFTGIGLG